MIYNKKLVLVNKEEESSIFNTKYVQDKHLRLILENYMTSILYRSDIDFDVFTAKLFVLVLWVSYSLEDQPGNEILISDLYKSYKNTIKKKLSPQSVMTDTRFYKEIAVVLSMFRMRNTKIKTPGGRGYIGLGFKNRP